METAEVVSHSASVYRTSSLFGDGGVITVT